MEGTYTPEQVARQAEMLANRVCKRHTHLMRKFQREGIEAFRLYDWDMPEIRAVVDWYAGHLVVGEYERRQTGPDWLPEMARAVGAALGVPSERIHQKQRRTAVENGPRYETRHTVGERFVVRERDMSFFVNLTDRLDTGLFSDHRETRAIVRNLAAGTDFLNLYAYTGTFTCSATLGGAKHTCTVDRSRTYMDWTRDNLALNGLANPSHELVALDTFQFLDRAAREGRKFTLAVVDPPSFSGTHIGTEFDIKRDHPDLLRRVFAVMARGAIVFFSTNHQRFEPRLSEVTASSIEEITPDTIPEDYRNRRVHRAWKIVV